MTKKDVDALFDLLAIYRPGDRHLEDRRLRAAWLLVLEPYGPAEVKQAVAAQFREHGYWPDVTDIATRCPKAVAEMPPEREGGFSAREIARINGQLDEMAELGRLMEMDYERAGVPHPARAREMGWSIGEWNRRAREAVEEGGAHA